MHVHVRVGWCCRLAGCPMRRASLSAAHPASPPFLHPPAEALSHAQVYVSPLLVGGWCGLVTTALNCLPVGNLDGGRTMLVGVPLCFPAHSLGTAGGRGLRSLEGCMEAPSRGAPPCSCTRGER